MDSCTGWFLCNSCSLHLPPLSLSLSLFKHSHTHTFTAWCLMLSSVSKIISKVSALYLYFEITSLAVSIVLIFFLFQCLSLLFWDSKKCHFFSIQLQPKYVLRKVLSRYLSWTLCDCESPYGVKVWIRFLCDNSLKWVENPVTIIEFKHTLFYCMMSHA